MAQAAAPALIGLALLLELPRLAVSLLVSMRVGALLCVIPGIFLALVWAVAVPVGVVEHVGPIDALTRSWQLTQGQWLPLFLMLFVLAMCFGGCLFVFSLPARSFGAMGGAFVVNLQIALYALSAVVSTLIAALLVTLSAELRALKEGVRPEQLAQAAW